LGVPLIAGRMFDDRDKANATGVVIIGKNVADKLFAGRDPIGRRIVYGSAQSTPDTIVGVVGDVKVTGLDDMIRPVLYYPYQQITSPTANLVVRTNIDPQTLAATIRNDIRTLEPAVAIFNVNTVTQLISNSPAAFTRRFPGLLISIFAGLALLLSAIGIYGVVSYSVSQQTHYIGIRMALGAQASDILRLVLKQGLLLSVIGVAVGAVGALALMRFLSSLLFEVQTSDVGTYAIVVGTLFIVTLVASYVPARRATKVDPLVALRYE
jgi:putative ABC transport system permease protein